MQHLHYNFHLNAGDQVIVNLDKQANVQLMDSNNYTNYRTGRKYTYFGGLVTRSPFTVSAPSQGQWHVAIDLGGHPGSINASVSVRNR